MGRGGGFGQVVAGMIAVALGIALTFISYLLAPPGGTYVIFIGLIVSGLVMIFRGIVSSGATSSTFRSYNRPAQSPISGYIAPPEQMPLGYCWQCGRKVKAQSIICVGCGATQIPRAAPHQFGNAVGHNERELSAPAPAGPSRWEPPPPPAPRNPAPAEQRHGPQYQPGGPRAWDPWDTWDKPPNPPTRSRRRQGR